LRKGLPRFVVFIMWDEVDWGSVSARAGMVEARGEEWDGRKE
jgi:hypothetical protein